LELDVVLIFVLWRRVSRKYSQPIGVTVLVLLNPKSNLLSLLLFTRELARTRATSSSMP